MFAMLFVTPAKARCSNGDKEYVTMFLPFVSEPNFLPIVKKNEGRAPKAVETISPIFNMASAKVCKRAKGYGIVIFVFPEQDRNLPIFSDCC